MLPEPCVEKAQGSQPGKTGSRIGSLEDKHLPIEQTKHDDGHEKQNGKQKMSFNIDKDGDIDKGEGETLATLTLKLSKLSLRGSYRKLKEMPGKVKRSRVVSLFRIPKEEASVGKRE